MKTFSRCIRTVLCLALGVSMLCGCRANSKKKEKDSEDLYEDLEASLAEKPATPEWTNPVPDGKQIEYLIVHMRSTYLRNNDYDISEYNCEYDDHGRMSVKIEKNYDSRIGDIRTVYTYNDDDLVIKEEGFYENNASSRNKDFYYDFEYDENGNLLSRKLLDIDGTLRYENKYSYDDAGNLIREEYGSNTTTYEYEFKNGVLYSCTETTDDGENTSIKTTTYDEKGNIVHIKSKTPYSDSDTKIEYDEHNNPTLYSSAVEGRRESEDKISYVYDDQGHILKKESSSLLGDYDSDGPTITTETYTYDAHGLLLYEVTRKNGEFYNLREYDYEPVLVPKKAE
ncbi:MAG: hypothetical protein IKG93_10795 [Clostridiales bacterium]|nr:hypothetical protein [Clostridiales bacterium]